jgi:shikimate 5-dehydrogenase
MIHFLDEPSRQKLRNLLVDGLVLLLIEAAQTLLYWLGARLDSKGMLDNFPQNAWHI